jgi:hypothetical protein
MLSWPALLLAPLVALGDLSLIYSLVTPSCARQDRAALHAVAIVSLLAVLAMTAMAWRAWHRDASRSMNAVDAAAGGRAVTRSDSDGEQHRPHFIALVSVIVGALSALVCAVLWLPIWVLSPCY